LFDFDHTHGIGLESLKRVAQELGDDRTEEELLEMLMEADLNRDGVVDEDEFLKIIRRRT
jgi:Ca2+-binding EF-hand superfamily protein